MFKIIRVLIIDDDVDDLQMFAETLSQIDTLEVFTAKDFMSIAQTNLSLFGVILLDYYMQPFNGLEIAKMIRRNYPDATIGLISGTVINGKLNLPPEAVKKVDDIVDFKISKTELEKSLREVVYKFKKHFIECMSLQQQLERALHIRNGFVALDYNDIDPNVEHKK